MNILKCYGYGQPPLKTIKILPIDEFIDKITRKEAEEILDIDEDMRLKLHNKLDKLSSYQLSFYIKHFLDEK